MRVARRRLELRRGHRDGRQAGRRWEKRCGANLEGSVDEEATEALGSDFRIGLAVDLSLGSCDVRVASGWVQCARGRTWYCLNSSYFSFVKLAGSRLYCRHATRQLICPTHSRARQHTSNRCLNGLSGELLSHSHSCSISLKSTVWFDLPCFPLPFPFDPPAGAAPGKLEKLPLKALGARDSFRLPLEVELDGRKSWLSSSSSIVGCAEGLKRTAMAVESAE